jgi:hypothetical protein
VAKYIYYGCTRSRNINCKEGYIEERELIKQLIQVIDQVNPEGSWMRKKLHSEIERYKKFHFGIIGKAIEKYSAKDVNVCNYAKYLLEQGSVFEKRDLKEIYWTV